MKVALFTDSDVFAGTERHMLDLALELRALGAAPTLVGPGEGMLAERGRAEGLPVFPLAKRGAIDPEAVRKLARLWEAGAFDVIHAHNGRTALLAALARRIARRGALVATQHFLTPARTQRRGLARFIGGVLHGMAEPKIRYHIAISRAVGDALLARHETAPAKLRIVLNGIRDPRMRDLASRAEVRARYGVPEEMPLLVCLARLDAEKGVDVLIDAMREVRRRNPQIRCLIAGRGALEGEFRARIAAHPETGVELAGFVEDSLSLVRAADLFVLPSLAEPFGLSIVEAMALEVPVISTRAGGPVEIIQEGKTGLLVPPGAAAPLTEAILALVSDPVAARAMGRAGRDDFQARFTAGRMAREMLAVYREASGA